MSGDAFDDVKNVVSLPTTTTSFGLSVTLAGSSASSSSSSSSSVVVCAAAPMDGVGAGDATDDDEECVTLPSGVATPLTNFFS